MERVQAAPVSAFTPLFCAVQQFCTLLQIPTGSKVVAVTPVDHILCISTVRYIMFLVRWSRNKGWASRSAAQDAKLLQALRRHWNYQKDGFPRAKEFLIKLSAIWANALKNIRQSCPKLKYLN
jgi:hypothetical protein